MNGREQLRAWLERSRVSQREAARLLGVHFTHVSQILSGRRSPGLANAIAIERATGIPVESWVPIRKGTLASLVSVTSVKRRLGKA